jgi:hypothetical protein
MGHTCHVDLLFIETCQETRDKISKQTTSVTLCEWTDKQTLEKNQNQALKKAFFLI